MLMVKVDEWTPQIWHCDPLVVTDETGNVLYADGAAVEFRASRSGDFIGHAIVTDAEMGPPIEIDVLTRIERMDRVPDIRLGMRNGFTLFGHDSNGDGVAWHIDGAADLFATCRAGDKATEKRHCNWLQVRDVESGVVRFSGSADLERFVPKSADDIEYLRAIPSTTVDTVLSIEVTDSRPVWPTLAQRWFGEVCVGIDSEGREVEWTLGRLG